MDLIVELIEPFFGLMKIVFVIGLVVVSWVCLVDLVQRLRAKRLQFSSRDLFLLLLIVAHAGSIAAFSRSAPSLSTRMQEWPAWLSVPVGFLIPVYIFGPIALLFGYGCHEASEDRPCYLLVAMLYLVAVRWMAALAS